MTLDELLTAATEADDAGMIDVTDPGMYDDDSIEALKTEAIAAGLAASSVDQKQQYLEIATILANEQNRRAAELQQDADTTAKVDEALQMLAADDQAAVVATAINPAVASLDDTAIGDQPDSAPVTAVGGSEIGHPAADQAADDTAADAVPAAQGPSDSALEAVANAQTVSDEVAGDAPADQADADGVAPVVDGDTAANDTQQPHSGEQETTMTTTDERMATLETQIADLASQLATTRMAGVTVGDAPGQVQATDPAPESAATQRVIRTASMTLTDENGVQEKTLDLGKLGAVMHSLAESSAGGPFSKIVASINRFESGTPTLKTGAANENTVLLFGGTESRRAARTAASMDCGPISRIERIPSCFTAVRPFADRITNKWPLETMKYEFYRSLAISDIAAPNGTQIVTEAFMNQIDPDLPATWKQCGRLDCDTVETVVEQGWAVWSCLILNEFQNMTIIPIAENRINLLAVQTARLAESQLLSRLRALSYQYTAVGPLGAGAGLLEIMDAAVAGYEWEDRLTDASWTPIIPRGLVRALQTDHHNQAFKNDTFDLNRLFTDHGYNRPIVIYDDHLGATPQWDRPGAIGGASVPLPTQLSRLYRIYIVDLDSLHMGQRNIISMREMRDMTLTRQNEYAMVMETAESLGRHGCIAPISIDVTLCPSGARAALEQYDCLAVNYATDIAV